MIDPAARKRARVPLVLASGAFAGALLAGTASAQQPVVTYSLHWHGPRIGQNASTPPLPITEGDLLRPFGAGPAFSPPFQAPSIAHTGGQLGLQTYNQCVGHHSTSPCPVEVDAFSYGNESKLTNPPSLVSQSTRLYFSVDEYAVGRGPAIGSCVRTQAPVGDAAASVFAALDLPAGPLPPGAAPSRNVEVLDGNGANSATGHAARGLGLFEPNAVGGVPPDPGDDLDALQLVPPPATGNVFAYFSLDASFTDPLGFPNEGTAAANGFRPGAVLRKNVNLAGTPTVFATPNQLGLDRTAAGVGSDDLDALMLAENGDGIFQPSQTPYDWGVTTSGPTDMLLFSVRRGSAVIGRPDSIFGLPIEEGDILVPPVAGGVSIFPGILIAAENLGLETSRSSTQPHGDELDALASTRQPFYDCNENGVEDDVDLANGTSVDTNMNAIPDECEQTFLSGGYCYCPSPNGPCGNHDPAAGCANSTGLGATLAAAGSTSVFEDDLVLAVGSLPPNISGRVLMSATQAQVPLGDGLRCVGGTIYRLETFNSGAAGAATYGPGVILDTCGSLPPAACIQIGATWHFQAWYRNVTGPCGQLTNLSHGLSIVFTP